MTSRSLPILLLLVPLVGACASSPAPAPEPAPLQPEPEPEQLSNTLRWSTASEVDNFGFDVFRSTSEEGPFEKVNQETIQGAGTVDTPSRYEFVDTDVEPGVTYYYYVESISLQGEREQFTPIIKSPPKQIGQSGSAAEDEDGQ